MKKSDIAIYEKDSINITFELDDTNELVTEFETDDKIVFALRMFNNGPAILLKEKTGVTGRQVTFSLDKHDTFRLRPQRYVYDIVVMKGSTQQTTVCKSACFIVADKQIQVKDKAVITLETLTQYVLLKNAVQSYAQQAEQSALNANADMETIAGLKSDVERIAGSASDEITRQAQTVKQAETNTLNAIHGFGDRVNNAINTIKTQETTSVNRVLEAEQSAVINANAVNETARRVSESEANVAALREQTRIDAIDARENQEAAKRYAGIARDSLQEVKDSTDSLIQAANRAEPMLQELTEQTEKLMQAAESTTESVLRAEDAVDTALAYRDEAQALKVSAENAALTATSQANVAKTKANEASSSASAASLSASNASTSASSAKAQADIASAKASDASTYAQNASASATSANTYAASSQTYSANAASNANVAVAQANAAKGYSEIATSQAAIAADKAGEAKEHLDNIVTEISNKADKATTLSGYGITDTYTKTETDNKYFLKTGGTVSGYLTIGSRINREGSNYDNTLELYGGSGYTNGSYLYLNGKNKNNGRFQLSAVDDNGTKSLIGTTDGNLIWNSKNISLEGHTHNYLPLSGGALSGDTPAIRHNKTDQYLLIGGGTNNNDGSWLALSGSTRNAMEGVFRLVATKDANWKVFEGKPDGTLTWNTKNISLEGHTHDYLPLNGGTVSGAIISSASLNLTKNRDDDRFIICGGTDSSGSYIRLSGKNESNATYKGGVQIQANDGTNSANIKLMPNGVFTCAGKEVERVNSSSTNYIRYENGLQICWGGIQNTNNVSDGITTATFSQPFSTVPQMSLVAVQDTVTPIHFQIKSKNATEFTFVTFTNNVLTRNGVLVGYIAIGKWK